LRLCGGREHGCAGANRVMPFSGLRPGGHNRLVNNA
jgi:hypothetical protein